MIPTVIVHCRALGRSLESMLRHIPDAIVFDAPQAPQHAGCIAGHQYAVRLARQHGWEAVGVLEDDCQFTEHFDTARWLTDLEWARTHGYNVLNGGCVRVANPRLARSGLYAIDRFKSAHCVAYLPAAFPAIDRLIYPMDYMIGRLGTRPLVTVPFVAIQAPGVSGHLFKHTDYAEDYARQEQRLLGVAA
jgi:hypothetical protein